MKVVHATRPVSQLERLDDFERLIVTLWFGNRGKWVICELIMDRHPLDTSVIARSRSLLIAR
jgi:hypothetical protein